MAGGRSSLYTDLCRGISALPGAQNTFVVAAALLSILLAACRPPGGWVESGEVLLSRRTVARDLPAPVKARAHHPRGDQEICWDQQEQVVRQRKVWRCEDCPRPALFGGFLLGVGALGSGGVAAMGWAEATGKAPEWNYWWGQLWVLAIGAAAGGIIWGAVEMGLVVHYREREPRTSLGPRKRKLALVPRPCRSPPR
jgi:hypothetical protein